MINLDKKVYICGVNYIICMDIKKVVLNYFAIALLN